MTARGARWWLMLVAVAACSVARADSRREVEEARRHYEEGTRAYNLGEFQTAVTEYKAAYKTLPDAAILYDIAQAYRQSNELGQALFFYRSFLRNAPNASNRREVEERIAKLEAEANQQRSIAVEPPNQPLPPVVGTPHAEPPRAELPPPHVEPPHAEPPPPRAELPPPHEPPPNPPSLNLAPPNPPRLTARTPAKAPPAPRPLYRKGWFWGVVVGGVVAIAGGVALGITLSGSSTNRLPPGRFQ